MKTADVVIIGGGVFGAHLAYALASHGRQQIVLLEQDILAGGSSSKATGGLRQQFAEELDIRFSVEGVRFYERFIREYMPAQVQTPPLRFDQFGYLFLCTTPESWQNLQIYADRQRKLDVPTELLGPAEIRRRVPQLVVDDVLGATFCQTDGYSDPGAMARAVAQAARSLGVHIQEHTPVTRVLVRRGKVQGVMTPQGKITAPVVVNAAGAYAALVARQAGIMDLPIWPLKRQLYQTESFDDLPQDVPMVVDTGSGFHFRRRDDGVVLTLPLPVSHEQIQRNRRLEPESFALNIEESLWPLIQAQIRHRCPTLGRATIRRVWAGLYEMTPDEHPILGATEIKGFLCGCGFSGHGFMHSPRAARLLAESIIGDTSNAAELALFSLARFQQNRLIHTTHLL